jgi:hypothetical protein
LIDSAIQRTLCAGSFSLLGHHNNREKEQGRRRSIPPTTLPAPDIEIGLRPSGGCSLARVERIRCDQSHNAGKKVHGVVSQMRLRVV